MATVATLRDMTEALIEAAKEDGKLSAVTRELEAFGALVERERELRYALTTSAYEVEDRKRALAALCEKAGFGSLTRNFLLLATEKGKLKELFGAMRHVLRRLREAAGIVRVELTFAFPPAEEVVERIREAVGRGGEVEVEAAVDVDPALVGGVVAKIENRLYDASVRKRLETIRQMLAEA